MKITIATPGHLASNPRVVKEAAALSAAGHVITIVHGQSVPWLSGQDAQLVDPDWTVITVPFGRPCVGFLRYLLQVITFRLALMLLRLLPKWLLPIRHLSVLASSPVARDLKSAVCRVPADLYIGHYIPALPAVVFAAERFNALYAFDAEDFHLGDLPADSRSELQRNIVHEIQNNYLPGAAYVTAAAPGIAEAYENEYAIRPIVVLNTFPKSLASDQPGPLEKGREVSVYWFSQTIGPDRGLESAIRAIGLADTRPHLYLRGNVGSIFRQTLVDIAKKHNVVERVHFLDIASPAEMVSLCRQYDVGLASETGHTMNRQIALTNKQFTYLLAGLPTLLSDIPAHVQFAEEAQGAAFLFRKDDAASLAQVLDDVLGSMDKLERARKIAWHLGQTKFNWEEEQGKLISLVSSLDSTKAF
jgi:glycosyltransferase involved in cell wall biosynthesis